MTCPAKYRYQKILGIEPEQQNTDAMDLGTLVHNGIEAALRSDQPLGAALASLDNADIGLVLQIPKARVCLENYIPMLGIGTKLVPVLGTDGNPLLEVPFDVPLLDGVRFRGYIDAVCRNQEDEIILIDWKTRGRFYGQNAIQLDAQLHLYAYILKLWGIKVDKAYQVQMRTPGPASPSLTVKGEISKKMGKTTEKYLIDGLANLGKQDAYDKLKAKIAPTEHWIEPIEVHLQTERHWVNARNWAARILKDDTYNEVARAYTCKFCPYKTHCS
jgi:CRISPR/Cas system-associated exonuclease Cas4 (RecB family)